jgi:hypothetical protein
VKNSWQPVKSETIVTSFKKCSIGNELDGSEDDFSDSDDDLLGFYDK